MFRAIMRERRRNAWKSQRKWQKAVRTKQRLEEQLRKASEYAEPDRWHNIAGVMIGVHVLRDRYRGQSYRFEFCRKDDAQKKPPRDFGEHDLQALVKAVEAAAKYRKFVETQERSRRSTAHGTRRAKPSKAASGPRVRQGSRK